MKKISTAKDFVNTMKDNPTKIIEWAENEIKEYKKLIKILKIKLDKKKNKSIIK